MENLGFRMEQMILAATALGLGTCWIGSLFIEDDLCEFVPDMGKGERIIAISPLGHADTSAGARIARRLYRWRMDRVGKRKPLSEIVSRDIWAVPWTDKDETLNRILNLARLAPSWENTQPWHFIVDDECIVAMTNHVPQKGNVREGKPYYRLDVGIAMSHIYLGARAMGWPGRWAIPQPGDRAQIRARHVVPDEYDILGTFPRHHL
jgi:nitroreductase